MTEQKPSQPINLTSRNNLYEAAFNMGAAYEATMLELEPDSKPFMVVPPGYEMRELERLLNAPRRKTGSFVFDDSESFCRYVKYHTVPCNDVSLWFDGKLTITAVLNGHAPNAPGWGDHRASRLLKLTPEWQQWMEADRKSKTQEEFALWLEENETAFREPTGAALLELITTLEARKDCRWKNAIRLQSGQVQFGYETDVTVRGSLVHGMFEMPSKVVAGIAPFKGTPLYAVNARLRYRLKDRTLALWFETIRPDLVRDDAIAAVLLEMEEQLGMCVYRGSAPA